MQDATETRHYRELVRETLDLELNLTTYLLERVTEFFMLEGKLSLVAVDKLALFERLSEMDNLAHQLKFNPTLYQSVSVLTQSLQVMFQLFWMRLLPL